MEKPEKTLQNGNELPKSWVTTTLDSIIEPAKERADPSKIPDTPYVGLEHIGKGTAKLLGVGSSNDVRSTKSVFHKGDLLYGKLRPYLNKVTIADFDGICSTDILVYSKVEGINQKYILYRMLAEDFVRFANSSVSGVQHPRTNHEKISYFQINLPPNLEQSRIVSELDALLTQLDAGIQSLRIVKKKIETYKSSVLTAACEGRLVPTEAELARQEGRDYEPASVLLERILEERRKNWEKAEWAKIVDRTKQKAANAARKEAGVPLKRGEKLEPEEWDGISEGEYARYLPKDDKWKEKYKEPEALATEDLPKLPEGWVWVTLEQVSWDSRYGTSTKCDYDGKGYPVIRIPNVVNGSLSFEDIKFALKTGVIAKDLLLKEEDLLIIRTNGSKNLIGKCGYIEKNLDGPFAFASYLIRFRIVGVGKLGMWLKLTWDSDLVRSQIMSIAATSAGQYNVSSTSLSRIALPLPPMEEIYRVIHFIEGNSLPLEKVKDDIVEAKIRAEQLRSTILKAAFSGNLVKQEDTDEPASILLEHIRAQREAQE